MTSVFGDTSYFLAMLVPTDANHAAARRWAQRNRMPIVASDYVLLEIGNYLSPASVRGLFFPFLQALRSDRRVTIVPASADLPARGIDLFRSRPDKNWSLTDCISFVINE